MEYRETIDLSSDQSRMPSDGLDLTQVQLDDMDGLNSCDEPAEPGSDSDVDE